MSPLLAAAAGLLPDDGLISSAAQASRLEARLRKGLEPVRSRYRDIPSAAPQPEPVTAATRLKFGVWFERKV